MGYRPKVEKEAGWMGVATAYTPASERSDDRVEDMCGGSAAYSVYFAEDKAGNIYVDVNPRANDGYEFKVVDRKKLFVWSNQRWNAANCRNILEVKASDENGGPNRAAFYDNDFTNCLRYRLIGETAPGWPHTVRGQMFQSSMLGVFLDVYESAIWSCVL